MIILNRATEPSKLNIVRLSGSRYRDQLKSLSGIETVSKKVMKVETQYRDQLKSLSGIETTPLLHQTAKTALDRDQLKSLSGIETTHTRSRPLKQLIAINLNPYQGLKPLTSSLSLWRCTFIAINLNPYQGLKLNGIIISK